MLAELRAVRAVAFDLDGTLVDSAADIGHALNTALAGAGLRCFDLATVRTWIGDGPDALIARALAAQGLSADDAALRQSLRAGFDAATLAAPLGQGRVFPGIAALLRQLSERRYPLAVVTNKPTRLAARLSTRPGCCRGCRRCRAPIRPRSASPRLQCCKRRPRSWGWRPRIC